MSKYPRARLVKGSIYTHLRRKECYDRFQAGESYFEIAHDLGITGTRARGLAELWSRTLLMYQRYMLKRETYRTKFRDQEDRYYQPLILAGLFGPTSEESLAYRRSELQVISVKPFYISSPIYGYA